MWMLLIAAAFIGGASFLLLENWSLSGKQVRGQLKRARGSSTVRMSQRERALEKSAAERLLLPIIQRLSDLATRLSPQASRVQLARQMQAAGMKMSPQRFMAVKGGLTVGGLVLGLIGAMAGQIVALPFGLVISCVGFIGPSMFLGRRANARRELMARMLPDTLDLLTVSVEAGLGFDSAIGKVVEKMTGPLVDEFGIMAREIRIGESRRQALRNMAERVGSPEVASFSRSIIQAEELGTALGRTLRVQAVDMRIRRQLAAEEKAMKAPVKMLFPTVLFIFPAMFIVILGPAILGMMNTFKQNG